MTARWVLPLVLGAACAACSEATPSAEPREPEDILAELRAIPGMTADVSADVVANARVYTLRYSQPSDHDVPGGARFEQRMTLIHRARSAPMVLYSSGYFLSARARETELAALLAANQLSVEHRFFVPSRPEPPTWEHLTIKQAAADHHRIIEAMRPRYQGAWLSTGASKGGMTALFHRRFYPGDVDATVAYVTPLMTGIADARFVSFLATVGDAPCRTKLADLQRTALARRDEILPVMTAWAREHGHAFEHLGQERAFEISVLETPFALFQYHSPSDCAAAPAATAPAADVFSFVERISDIAHNYADADVEAYAPYWVQAATELGAPAIPEEHVRDVLRFPGNDTPSTFTPRGAPSTFRPEPMRDVADWIARDGSRLLLIYGANDPWSAGAVELTGARDSFRFFVPAGNHGAKIADLPDGDRASALDAVRRWASAPSLHTSGLPAPELWRARRELQGEGEPRFRL